MKLPRPARALYALSILALAYSSLLVLSFACLYGPSWLNRTAGWLLYGLLWPVSALGVTTSDGVTLLAVIALAASGVFASGLLAFCCWLFLGDDTTRRANR